MRARAHFGRDLIAAGWRAERAAGLLQWAAIALALISAALAVLRALGLARFGGGGA